MGDRRVPMPGGDAVHLLQKFVWSRACSQACFAMAMNQVYSMSACCNFFLNKRNVPSREFQQRAWVVDYLTSGRHWSLNPSGCMTFCLRGAALGTQLEGNFYLYIESNQVQYEAGHIA